MRKLEFAGRLYFVFVLLSFNITCSIVQERKRYSMYVWDDGFDPYIEGCDEEAFLDSDPKCYSHNWNTPEKRQYLWKSCNIEGREISSIFLSGIPGLKYAKENDNCDTDDIKMVRETLHEGHSKVPELSIFALYAVSDIDVTEQDLVQYVVYYNDNCIESKSEMIDGVAVNNEAYSGVKCGDLEDRRKYLDNLQRVAEEAKKQKDRVLQTHYSVGWHWGQCDDQPSVFEWNNKNATASIHMINIFDEVDVQAAYTTESAIQSRLKMAGYDYAISEGKDIHATVYTNKALPCQTSFFPDEDCKTGNTEAEMFEVFDALSKDEDAHFARPCIHYFRGSYCSGGHRDWPLC